MAARSPPLGVLIVTVVRPAFDAFQVVPGGPSVTCVVPTVNVAGMAIRTQPRSCCPSGPPRFQNVALTVVAWRASIVDGLVVGFAVDQHEERIRHFCVLVNQRVARGQLEFVRELGDLRELPLRAVREERHLAQELRSVPLPHLHAGIIRRA